jgi:hypothetical protein
MTCLMTPATLLASECADQVTASVVATKEIEVVRSIRTDGAPSSVGYPTVSQCLPGLQRRGVMATGKREYTSLVADLFHLLRRTVWP